MFSRISGILFVFCLTPFVFSQVAKVEKKEKVTPEEEFDKIINYLETESQKARKEAGGNRHLFYVKLLTIYQNAEEKAKNFVKNFPNSTKVFDAQKLRCELFRALGKFDDAKKLAEEVKKCAKTTQQIKETAFLLARLNRSYDAGLNYLKQIISETKDIEQKAELTLASMMYLNFQGKTKDKNKIKQMTKDFLKKVAKDFPKTKAARKANMILQAMDLGVGKEPVNLVDFKDTEGKPIDLVKDYKGKVVLLDFWATWCMPCMMELPNVKAAYEKYHKKGFEILSISFDQDKKAFEKVIKEQNMVWRHYFDGQGWGNKIGEIYQIRAIPHTILIGKDGKIAAINLRGEALIAKVKELVEQKVED